MPETVLDASVVLKWIPVPNEDKVSEAWEVYKHLVKREINAFAPTFLLIEVLNILICKRKADKKKVRSALRILRECNIQFETLAVGEEIVVEQLMFQHSATAYDALYLSLAQKKNCKLMTYDSELLKIKSLTISVEDYLRESVGKEKITQ